jgi:hypothetical protein
MKNSIKFAIATLTAGIASGGVHAQEVLINQQLNGVPGDNSDEIDLINENTATSTNETGFGPVSLQAFQSAANTLNQAIVNRSANAPPGSISQTFGPDLEIDVDTNNTIAAFSANGPQLVRGSQVSQTGVNSASVLLGNATSVTIAQNFFSEDGGLDLLQNNILSAGYTEPSMSGAFAVGTGTAAIQGQALTPNPSGMGSIVVNTGFQTNAFSINSTGLAVGGAATATVAQKAGNLNAELYNFADAGIANSGAAIDPSIDNIAQSISSSVNRIESLGATNDVSTLVLDAAGGSGFQQAGFLELPPGVTDEYPQTFSVRNSMRALTWNNAAQSPPMGSTVTWTASTSGGNGDVAIRDSSQSLALGFNSINAISPSQSVVFGGSGAFAQTANYTAANGISITSAIDRPNPPDPLNPPPPEGYADFGVNLGSTSPDNAVNNVIAGTRNGAAFLSNIGQTAGVSFNASSVAGTASGTLVQTANIGDGLLLPSPAPTPLPDPLPIDGPVMSNVAVALVGATGVSAVTNVDQTSTIASNDFVAGGVGTAGLQLTQSGFKGIEPVLGSIAERVSQNVIAAVVTNSTTLGANARVSGLAQSITDQQNTFAAGASNANISLDQTLTNPDTNPSAQPLPRPLGYGGVNGATVNALNGATGAGLGAASLSDGVQTGEVNLNVAALLNAGTTDIAQSAVTATNDPALNIYGKNNAEAIGKTSTISNYGQRYDVALNSATLGGVGIGNISQDAGEVRAEISNSLAAKGDSASINGAAQIISVNINAATLNGGGSLTQTSGPVISNLTNTMTVTGSSRGASSITGVVQSVSQSLNTSN